MSLTILFAYGEAAFHVFLAAVALGALRKFGLGAWRNVAAAVGAVKIAQEAAVTVAAIAIGRPLEHPGETVAWALTGTALVVIAVYARMRQHACSEERRV
ncbi:MAG TPA: hypothetical protein VL426_00290 [Candidatus Binatia bacterium]|jgi:hypothetical protein|nr:hypothetical protein [Candidatus Binatia bacterium]